MLQKSYRTKTTDVIMQFIQQNHEKGFTASELSAYLCAHDVKVNKTTVYRNLDKMTENGQLIKQKSLVADGFVYQTAEQSHHCEDHIHFQCCRCGSLIHLSDEKTAEYLRALSDDLGVLIDVHVSSLNGLCPQCRTQK